MKRGLRNILAVLAGLLVGSVLNMALVSIGGRLIPAPAGADVTSMEGLKASMHLFTPVNFVFPFLAHAMGTFVGAIMAAFIAIGPKMRVALIIGACFLVGGILSVAMIASPLWFTLADLIVAYLPMAYLAGRMMEVKKAK